MTELDKDTAESVARVYKTIQDHESDSDHTQTLNNALDRLWEIYGEKLDVNGDSVTVKDVERTFTFSEEYAPDRSEREKYRENNDGRHPNTVFSYTLDFVDHNERYTNGCLPSARDWDVTYVRNGDVIEERTYNHDDEIPTDPTINGIRHECERTKRRDGEVTVYVSKDPVRDDVDIIINAVGDDFINVDGHDGPNVKSGSNAIDKLADKFDWGSWGDTNIVLTETPEKVYNYLDDQGWVYEKPE